MFYEYIAAIDDTLKFQYITLIITAVFLMNRIMPNMYSTLGLMSGLAVVLYLNSRSSSVLTSYIQDMTKIMDNPIFKPYSHLYRDSKLLQFLHSIRVYHSENPYTFTDLTIDIDNYIALSDAIIAGAERWYNEQYEMLKAAKVKILNTFHSFIFVTPHITSRLNFYQERMGELEHLLNYHIDKIHTHVVQKNNQEITTMSKFPRRNEIPGPGGDRFAYFS